MNIGILDFFTSIAEIIGFPSIVSAVIAFIVSRVEEHRAPINIDEIVQGDFPDSELRSKLKSYLINYDANRKILRDQRLVEFSRILQRDNLVDSKYAYDEPEHDSKITGNVGSQSGKTGRGVAEGRRLHLGHIILFIALLLCPVLYFISMNHTDYNELTLLQSLDNNVTEASLQHNSLAIDVRYTGIAALLLVIILALILKKTENERACLQKITHGTSPILLVFLMSTFLVLGKVFKEIDLSVEATNYAPDGWPLFAIALVMMTVTEIVLASVLILRSSTSYAVEKTVGSDYITTNILLRAYEVIRMRRYYRLSLFALMIIAADCSYLAGCFFSLLTIASSI